MDLQYLRYFYEVARSGSFTLASRQLHVSQPSISKMVKLLEERQGVRLFDRGKKGVTLTEQGRLFYLSCQKIFNELDGLQSVLTEKNSELSGVLRVGASDNLCNYILPALFSEFYRLHPKVVVQLLSGTAQSITEELEQHQLDLGLFYTPIRDKRSFESTKLWDVEFVVVCREDNKVMRQAGFTSKGLASLPYVGSRHRDYSKPYPALDMLQSVGIEPKTVFETNNQETQKRMVLEQIGYTVVPIHMVQKEIEIGLLRVVRLQKKLVNPVYLVHRRNHSLSRQALAFFDFLKGQRK